MLVEESTHVTSKRPVFGLAGGVQRSGSLFIGTAYLSPADRAGGDERRQLILAPRDGDGLFVGAAVGMGNLATPFGSQPRPELDERHARSGNRSEEHTSELQSLMRHSYAVFCLKKKKNKYTHRKL